MSNPLHIAQIRGMDEYITACGIEFDELGKEVSAIFSPVYGDPKEAASVDCLVCRGALIKGGVLPDDESADEPEDDLTPREKILVEGLRELARSYYESGYAQQVANETLDKAGIGW